MGKIINLKCSKCKTENALKLGCGIKDTEREWVLCFCDNCRKYSNFHKDVSDNNLYMSGKSEDRAIAKCSCGATPRIIFTLSDSENGKHLVCQICGTEMEVKTTGFFD